MLRGVGSARYGGLVSKQQIRQLIEDTLTSDGLVETRVRGVHLFRVTEPIRCAPAVYEPTVVAIVGGTKEAILDGTSYRYDDSRFLCCAMPMPVEAGTPTASPEDPLLGVQISLDARTMTELALEMETAAGAIKDPRGGPLPGGMALAEWDSAFTDALWRVLQLGQSPADAAVLGGGRLRELYYALLTGEAGPTARRAFGVGNEIARMIEEISAHLDDAITIEDMAAQVGMSRAVFHRRFKEATTMSPIQFVKAIRLNTAAMKMAGGMTVNQAATAVGYANASQFSREFKRAYGQSPKQWSQTNQPVPVGAI